MLVREPSKNKAYWNDKKTVCIYWDNDKKKWFRHTFQQVIDESIVEISEVDAAYHTTTMDSKMKK